MAATSMMKEYLKKQLKYWVDNFKDDQLPRDFNSKSFSRSQITLNKITLKPDKLAALLHIPHPLIVTRATCSELSIKVPSWNIAEKFVQEPLSLRITDLFIDVKHIDECDDHVRKNSQARARAASLEPDPLGSIASMYQFATIIHERLEISVENITIKLYEKQTLRLRVEMLHFHARTTNAMWQDMRDLTECVDRSPDGLLKTRFKFVSTQCSVYLHHSNHQELPSASGATGGSASTDTSIRLLRDHAIAMRMTMFGHRKSKHDAWEVLSSVVDLNLETLPFEMDTTQLQQVFALYCTLATWATTASNKSSDADTGLLPHQLMRGPLTPKRKPTTTATTESSSQNQIRNQQQDKDPADDQDSSFALQVTVRFTAHMLLKVQSSRRGVLQLALIAQQAAVNWIQHHDESHEMQVTVHDLSLRHKDKVLFHVKPARDVLQLKRHVVASTGSVGEESSVYFLKWHLQKLECHLENDIAMVVNELYHSMNEIEQAATITCGTCHHKIRLDAIESHVCVSAPATVTVNGSRRNSLDSTNNNNIGGDNTDNGTTRSSWLDSASIPKLCVVLALDELEIVTDSHLFSTVQELMRNSSTNHTNGDSKSSSLPPVPPPARRFMIKMKDWSISTESKEFVGDAIFVPVLPLAFQMLECTIRGCGCVYRQQRKQQQKRHTCTTATAGDGGGGGDGVTAPPPCAAGVARRRPRWPDRIFAELGHFSLKAIHLATKSETFVTADGTSLRLSFSDGAQICARSAPQMSSYFHIERIRCQLEHHVFQQLRSVLSKLQDPVEGKQGQSITALTLFFAVWEIRNVELTLLHEHHTKTESQARMKAQFRHVGGVADNHQGHLSLQTNFDFRALLQSDAIQFEFPSSNAERLEGADHDPTIQVETKRARRRGREQAQRERSAQRIQRVFRGFAAARRELLDQQLRHLTRDDQEANGDDLQSQLDACQTKARRVDSQHESETMPQQQPPRRKSSGKSALFGSASDDLAAINPMKMVAAAGVFKDGVMGFVKAKQQQIESEMSDLATQSKESAARFMPKYSAVKNLLSPRMGVATTRTTTSPTGMNGGATTELGAVESVSGKQAEVREVDVNDTETPVATEGEDEEQEGQEEQEEKEEEENEEDEEEEEEEVIEEEREETGAPAAYSDQEEEEGDDDEEELGDRNGGDNEDRSDGQEPTSPPLDAVIPELIREQSVSATDALLASLPVVVRVMVQVEEHRMCVPINPRESVGVLCREIVRRFNEMFANSGVITHVTLQNPQGGVFAVSDIVGLIYDPIGKPQELFFAYPHDEDAEIKSVVHIQSALNEPTSSSSASNISNENGGISTHSSFKGSSSANKTTKQTQSGCAFTRCTKLPLPLVVALLANESERDLLRHVMKDTGGCRGGATGGGGGGGGGGDEWPELALNASFLDPKREMLQVEVCWRGKSLHVSNADAFLLCLQQLGLCTSRGNSKYVGKILRDRLKMDLKNPLIHAACTHSAEFQEQFQAEVTTTTEQQQQQQQHDPKAFYESLQEIVQEDYGVYMRSQD